MKRRLILFILAFTLGFLTHALLVPDFLANGLTDVSQIVLSETTSLQTGEIDPLITQISYDGEKFSRSSINIGYTRYIQITNTNKTKPMWLQSNKTELNTTRGYAFSEAVKAQFNEKGTFLVQDKNNPSEKIVITVK
jgi:hypothetical protein